MGSKKLRIWIPLICGVILSIGILLGYALSGFRNFHSLQSVSEILSLLKNNYVDDISSDSLKSSMIRSVLSGLDPHTLYFSPAMVLQNKEELQDGFKGIGVEFLMIRDTVNIVGIIPGSPAASSGVQLGDKFLSINDTVRISGRHLSDEAIRIIITQTQGSSIKVAALRNGHPIKYQMARSEVENPSVDACYFIAPRVGYIRLNRFESNTASEFHEALLSLKNNGMTHFILDLRGNGGGYVDAAVRIADEFLSGKKLIVYTEGAHSERTNFYAKDFGLFEHGPMVVLIDETTASASEILTGALQDWDRAEIIGRRSFGKGLVQSEFNLHDGGVLRMTIARYFTPLGRFIQKSYRGGKEVYDNDLQYRMLDGELFNGHNNQNGRHAYRTPEGRLVYGGGGITPDIFVPMDTLYANADFMSQIFSDNKLSEFVLSYYLSHRIFLNEFKNAMDLCLYYDRNSQDLWNAFLAFARLNHWADFSHEDSAHRNFIYHNLLAYLCRQRWGHTEYFEALNLYDPVIQQTLRSFHDSDFFNYSVNLNSGKHISSSKN